GSQTGYLLLAYGYSFTGNTTAGSNVVTGVSSLSGLSFGQTVTGAGIPLGATITAVGTNSVTLSAAATAGGSAVAFAAAAGGNYTPAQIRQAYGINNIVVGGGVYGDGTGTTIAILESGSNDRFVNSTLPGYASSDLSFFSQVN